MWGVAWALFAPRAGFNWIYVAPSAPALAVLFGCAWGPGRARRLRELASVAVLGAALVLATAFAFSRGTEDYRGAVQSIVDALEPGDAVVAVEWQPPVFDQGLAWKHYAPRLAGPDAELPPVVTPGEHFILPDPEGLLEHDRVFLLRRALPEEHEILALLRTGYRDEAVEEFGYGLWVHRFSEPVQ